MDAKVLQFRQALPLFVKEGYTAKRIKEWYNFHHGDVYVSFSGGKDSTVLLHQVRKIYPHVSAVFVDTGLEFPEIREFVKQTENVIWLKPKITFKQVLTKYGYPVVSKKISMGISRYRNTKSNVQKELRLHGGINPTSGKKQQATVSKKWHFLIEAPFKISEQCCMYMKKKPIKLFNKDSGLHGYVGTMACDSHMRKQNYLKHGCNNYVGSDSYSTPMSFWKEEDVWVYLKKNKIAYSKIYDMGYDRTGCIFCMFGMQMERGEDRFSRMSRTHPKQYKYCMDKLGLREVINYVKNVDLEL